MKYLTGNELMARLRETDFSANDETLLYVAAQNVIHDTPEAIQDLVDELSTFAVQPSTDFKRTRMYPKCMSDPEDKLSGIYRNAESAYLRRILQWNGNNLPSGSNIYCIDYCENQRHAEAFNATKEIFLKPDIDASECFMFHGTDDSNIDLILQSNFDQNFNPTNKAKFSAYGEGIYFSEIPTIASVYGTLILCHVLPGRVKELTFMTNSFTKKIPDQFDSRRIVPFGQLIRCSHISMSSRVPTKLS